MRNIIFSVLLLFSVSQTTVGDTVITSLESSEPSVNFAELLGPDDVAFRNRMEYLRLDNRQGPEKQSVLREEMFRAELLAANGKLKNPNPRYLVIADAQGNLIRETAATLARIRPVLQPFETLAEIEKHGFGSYTDQQKRQSEFYLKTVLQHRLIQTRLEFCDSGGAVKTALEITAIPERDRALLEIISTIFWPANVTDGMTDRQFEKSARAASFLSENGRELGLFYTGLAHLERYGEKQDPKKPKTYDPSDGTDLEAALKCFKEIKSPGIFNDPANAKNLNWKIRWIRYRIRIDNIPKEVQAAVESVLRFLDSRITDPYTRCRNEWLFPTTQARFEAVCGMTDKQVDTKRRIELLSTFIPHSYESYESYYIFSFDVGIQAWHRLFELVMQLPDDDPLLIETGLKMLGDQCQRLDFVAQKEGKQAPSEENLNRLADRLLKSAKVRYPAIDFEKNDSFSGPDKIRMEIRQLFATLLNRGRNDAMPVFLDMNIPDTLKKDCCYAGGGLYWIAKQPEVVKKRIHDFFAATDRPEFRYAFLNNVFSSFHTYNKDNRFGPFPWEEFVQAAVHTADPAERITSCTEIQGRLKQQWYRKIIHVDPAPWQELLRQTLRETLDEVSKSGDAEKIRNCCSIIVAKSVPNPDDRELVLRAFRLLDADYVRLEGDPVVVLLRLSHFYQGPARNYRDDFSPEERKARLEKILTQLDAIPDTPPSEKLNAYKHAVQLASLFGFTDECRRLADRAVAFARQIPGDLEKFPRFAVPLQAIRRFSSPSN